MPLLSIGIVVLDQRPLGVGQAPQWRGAKAPMELVKGGPEIAKTTRRPKRHSSGIPPFSRKPPIFFELNDLETCPLDHPTNRCALNRSVGFSGEPVGDGVSSAPPSFVRLGWPGAARRHSVMLCLAGKRWAEPGIKQQVLFPAQRVRAQDPAHWNEPFQIRSGLQG